MKIIKPLNQSLLYKVFEEARKCYLSVGILSFFPFDADSGLLTEIDLWKCAASELGKDAMPAEVHLDLAKDGTFKISFKGA